MIQSDILGFDLSPNQLRAVADLMTPISDAITFTESEGKYTWQAEALVAQEQIGLKMTISPKAYTHPDRVLGDMHSLLQLGDGGLHAVYSGLISVPVADAADITSDMIHSLYATSGCTLVTMYFQTLTKHQQK